MIGDEQTDKDTIVFHFDVECTTQHVAGSSEPVVVNDKALSGALKWLPQGTQAEMFPGETCSLAGLFDVLMSVRLAGHSSPPLFSRAHSTSTFYVLSFLYSIVLAEGVAPVHDDIVVAKLKPGQRIEFEAHCRKGVGKLQ